MLMNVMARICEVFRSSRRSPLPVPSDAELRRAGIGSGDFLTVGNEFVHYLKQLLEVGPHDAVLEAGCGIGRIAVPLTTWLEPPGSYRGFDVVQSSVSWCQRNISNKYSHFQFRHVDVANSLYNPTGTLRGEHFRFPFEDSVFDVGIAVSLFTHLRPTVAGAYLTEMHRVLKPQGRLLSTWFMLPIERRDCAVDMFRVDCDSYRVAASDNPDAVVSFTESAILEMHERAGLVITKSIRGHWARGVHAPPYQDMLIATAIG